MQRRGKSKTTRPTKSSRSIGRRKPLYPNQNLDVLKTNFHVATGICKIIGQSTGGRELFENMLNLIGRSVEFSHASLFLLDRKENKMEEVASVGKKVDLIDFVRFDAGVGLSAWVAKEKRPILLSNLHRKRGGEKVKSFLAIPLILNDEVFGVMNLCHATAHAFEPEDVEFLKLISGPVVLSLERVFYHSEVKRLKEEIQRTREYSAGLEEKITRMEGMTPTPQLLESLKERINSPLSNIAENAQFLLDSFSPRQEQKLRRLSKSRDVEFKRGLKAIKSEINQITRTTERLLKKGADW